MVAEITSLARILREFLHMPNHLKCEGGRRKKEVGEEERGLGLGLLEVEEESL